MCFYTGCFRIILHTFNHSLVVINSATTRFLENFLKKVFDDNDSFIVETTKKNDLLVLKN